MINIKLSALVFLAATMALQTDLAHSKDKTPTIEECIKTLSPDCFDPLLLELSTQISKIKDSQIQDGYSTIPSALLLRAGKPKLAEAAVGKIKNIGKKDAMLSHLGVLYVDHGQLDDARRVLSQIEEPYGRSLVVVAIAVADMKSGVTSSKLDILKMELDSEFADETFSEIARLLINNDQIADGAEVASLISDLRLKSHLYALISRIFAERGQIQKTLENLRRVEDLGLKITAMGQVGIEFQRGGFETESESVFLEAINMISSLKVDDPARSEFLESIANDLINGGYINEAVDAVNNIDKPSAQAHLFYKIGAHYANEQKHEMMNKYFDISSSLSDEVDDPYRQLSTLHSIVVRLAKEGQMARALKLSEKIAEMNNRSNTLSLVGNIVLKSENVALTEQIYNSLEHTDIRVSSLIRLAKYFTENGDEARAVSLLSKSQFTLSEEPVIADKYQDGVLLRGSTISSLSSAYLERDDFVRSIKVAKTIPLIDQRISQFIRIFGVAVENQKSEIADNLNEIIFMELAQHPNAGDILPLITYLSTHSSNLENLELQRKFSALLTDERSRSSLFSAISLHLAINGKSKLALQVINEISDPTTSTLARIDVLSNNIEKIIGMDK